MRYDQPEGVVPDHKRLSVVDAAAADAGEEPIVADHHAAVAAGVEVEPDAAVRDGVFVKLRALKERPAERNAVGDVPNLIVMHPYLNRAVQVRAPVADHDPGAVRPGSPGAWPADKVLHHAIPDLDDRVAIARQVGPVAHAGKDADRKHLPPRRPSAHCTETAHPHPLHQRLPCQQVNAGRLLEDRAKRRLHDAPIAVERQVRDADVVEITTGLQLRSPAAGDHAVIGGLDFPVTRPRHELEGRRADAGPDNVPAGAQPDAVRLVVARQKAQHQPVAVMALLPGQAIKRLAKLGRRRGVDRLGRCRSVPEGCTYRRKPNRALRRAWPSDLLRPGAWPSGGQGNDTELEQQSHHCAWPSLAPGQSFVNRARDHDSKA